MAMTHAPRSSPLRGVLLMMGALALFALLDTLSKGLAASHPVPVIVWGRYSVHFLITLLVFMPRHGFGLFRSHRPGLQVLRGPMLVTTTALVGTVAMSIVLPWYWLPGSLGLAETLQIGSLGLIAAVSHLLLIMAFRAAPATTPSPFSYAQLAWATLFGWIAFDDLPDLASFAGMGIIAASGLGVACLEHRKREEPDRE